MSSEIVGIYTKTNRLIVRLSLLIYGSMETSGNAYNTKQICSVNVRFLLKLFMQCK